MSQEANKIKIKTTNGGNDGNDLKNCYFLPTNQPNSYVFFDSTGTPIVTTPMPIVVPLASGTSVTFQLNNFNWWIPNPAAGSEAFQVNGTGPTATASGSWANNDGGTPPRAGIDPSLGDDGTGESGTFQAQAGQQVDPEGEEAASAAKA